MLGRPSGVIYVAEGYSTAASVYEATGQCAVCAFDAGNLAPVVEGLRTAWPRAEIVIAADNDASGAGMDGARRGKPDYIVMPDKVGDDWNDVLVKEGREAVLSGAQTRIVRVMASGSVLPTCAP
jgi:putative DNA primase/helicase